MQDFPGPGGLTVGQVFTSAGKSWQWDGAKWVAAAGGGAPLDSPSFTGDPKAPTPATADNDTSIATTAFVKAQGYLLNNQVITLSGDVGGSGTTAITTTLATVPVAKGGTGATTFPVIGTNATTNTMLVGNGTGALAPAGGANDVLGTYGNAGAAFSNFLGAYSANAAATQNPGFDFGHSRGTLASPAASQSADGLGNIQFLGYGTSWGIGAALGAFTTQLWSATAHGGELRILTTANNTTFQRTVATFGQDGIITAIGPEIVINRGVDAYAQFTVTNTTRSWGMGVSAAGGGGNWYIYDNTAAQYRMQIDSTGACKNTTGTWSAISDGTLKENVSDYTSSLAEIIQLRPVTFTWKEAGFGPEINWGLIAQEVEPVMPELIGEATSPGPGDEPLTIKTVDYGRIIFSVINSLREISQRLDSIEARLAALEVA